jgi:hypothetical protein
MSDQGIRPNHTLGSRSWKPAVTPKQLDKVDRGPPRGIMAHIANAQAHPEPATARAAALMPTVTLSTNLWIEWAHISIRHALDARGPRALGAAALAARDIQAASRYVFTDEVRLCMVSMTAAAFAVEGLDGVVRPLVDKKVAKGWVARGKSGHAQIRLALDYCYRCEGTLPDELVTEFKWLFTQVRGPGVHHKPRHNSPEIHPLSGMGGVASERALYATENADRAVRMLLTVVDLVCDPNRAKTSDMAKVASDFATIPKQLRDLWDSR